MSDLFVKAKKSIIFWQLCSWPTMSFMLGIHLDHGKDTSELDTDDQGSDHVKTLFVLENGVEEAGETL